MTNTFNFAKRELDILVKSSTDLDNRPIVEPFIKEILELCEKFGLSGQSGGSAPVVAIVLGNTIKSLCLQEPICAITGIEEEWNDVTEMNEGVVLYQNNRCGAVFKNAIGQAYYLDAIAWKVSTGQMWNGSAYLKDGTKVLSRQFIEFPFTPKTFYVDVINVVTENNGDGDFHIKDEKQLQAVYKLYKKPL